MSRPTRACELKWNGNRGKEQVRMSRPTRACELKSGTVPDSGTVTEVTPHAGV